MPFKEWVRGNWKRFYASVSSFGLVGAFKIADWIKPSRSWLAYPEVTPFLLNVLGVLVIIAVIAVGRRPNVDAGVSKTANRLLIRFDRCWQWVWFAFFALYLYLLLAHALPLSPLRQPAYQALDLFISNLLGNLVTVPIVLCYLCLAWYHRPDHRATGLVVIGVILLTIPDLLLVVMQSTDPALVQKAAFWRFVVALGGGFVSCLALAMLAGRLESRLINAPFWTTLLLYFYAALQIPLSLLGPMDEFVRKYAPVMIADAYLLRSVITIAGWFLKAFMFLFVYWLLDSGILLFYLDRTVRYAGDRVEIERSDFLRSLTPPEAEGV